MSDDAQRWKEKYLKSIEQQDKLERRWAARLDLLRRGLVRSTLAAEGTDKVVDQCMKEMRDVVRTDDVVYATRTSFNVGAMAVVAILVALYTLFW